MALDYLRMERKCVLPGHSCGVTAQYKYIGNSIERNYFNEIVLRLR